MQSVLLARDGKANAEEPAVVARNFMRDGLGRRADRLASRPREVAGNICYVRIVVLVEQIVDVEGETEPRVALQAEGEIQVRDVIGALDRSRIRVEVEIHFALPNRGRVYNESHRLLLQHVPVHAGADLVFRRVGKCLAGQVLSSCSD